MVCGMKRNGKRTKQYDVYIHEDMVSRGMGGVREGEEGVRRLQEDGMVLEGEKNRVYR